MGQRPGAFLPSSNCPAGLARVAYGGSPFGAVTRAHRGFARERTTLYPAIVLGSWALFFLGGCAAGLLAGHGPGEAAQFGASLSLSHLWGYRNYETFDDSRNNWLVALISSGEGWHNNHHADPRSASHGHGGWEIDLIYLFVRGLEKLGLAKDVRRPGAGLKPGAG